MNRDRHVARNGAGDSSLGGGSGAPSDLRVRACCILVVDDNEDGAELMSVLLKLQGHTVEVAHDGVAALKSAAAFDPDVVLLDIGLPGLDGYAVAKQLRDTATGRLPCLIAMTGYGTDEDRRRTQEAGFDHHVVKPIEPADLNALLARSIAAMGI